MTVLQILYPESWFSVFTFHYEIVEHLLQFRRMRDVISNKEHEIVSLRRQLDSTSEELTEVGRAREVALRENRRLQDDLATMTRENQVANFVYSLFTRNTKIVLFFRFAVGPSVKLFVHAGA